MRLAAPLTGYLALLGALLLVACPSTPAMTGELRFTCEGPADCLLGFTCRAGVCVRSEQGTATLDATAGDQPGAPDGQVLDAAVRADARADVERGDSPGPDATVEAGLFDAPASDSLTVDTAGRDRPPSCEELYGLAPDYLLCDESAVMCRFYVDTNGGICADLCADHGGTCRDAWDNSGTCGLGSHDGCTVTHSHQICECSRP